MPFIRVLDFLARHAMVTLAAGVFLGLALPQVAHTARPLLVPAVFVMLAATLVKLDWPATLLHARRPLRAVLLLLWLGLGTPLLMDGVVHLLEPPPGLAAALVLMASSSPIISSIPLAMLLRLDGPLATLGVAGSMLLLPLYLPPLALWLLGLQVDIGLGAFMLRLGALIGGALAVALVVRRLSGPARIAGAETRIDGLVVAMMLIFAVSIMDGVTATLVARPERVLLYIAAAFAANLALQAAGAVAFAWMGRSEALTCGLISGNRNMAVLLAVLAGQAGFDITLYFAVGQLPIYILPMLLQPLYRRLRAGA